MVRPRKIALIGAQGYAQESPDLRVDCFPWDKINTITNLRDYDILLLNLLSLEKVGVGGVDWSSFIEVLNPGVTIEILRPGGFIFIIGDPRFSITRKSLVDNEDIERPFLNWTGLIFHWDNQPGDTVIPLNPRDYPLYQEYLKNLKQWEYSLVRCELNLEVFGRMYDFDSLHARKMQLKISERHLCQNRYNRALAFLINIRFDQERRDQFGDQEVVTVETFSPIVFLPKTELDEDETLTLVLRDLCGVESKLPEPEWIAELEAPGQEDVDKETRRIETEIEKLVGGLRATQAKREKVRACLELLYQRGESLEKTVKEIMKGLGAQIEEPDTPGKEDGWITVQIEDNTFEGVLEVKSTKNPQFDQTGLRQLLDWISRGVEMRQKKYKGIFVGSNAVEKPIKDRPEAFNDDWRKSAELHNIVALKVEDLHLAHVLNASGQLDCNEFWRNLFGTCGIFDSSPYSDMLV